MSTLDINIQLKLAYKYLIVSIICALVGGIYELYGHEVYSYYMLYAFGFPLVLGAFPWLTIGLFKSDFLPDKLTRSFYHCGIATLTIGSIFRGVLDIFGTTNPLSRVYWVVGIALMVVAVFATCAKFSSNQSAESTTDDDIIYEDEEDLETEDFEYNEDETE